MPGYKGHLTGGFILFVIMIALLGLWCTIRWYVLVEWCACVLAGSLFPDIDIASKGQKLFFRAFGLILVVIAVLQQWQLLTVLLLAALVPLLVNHRGLFHKLWFVGLFIATIAVALIRLFPETPQRIIIDVLWFYAGIISHLYLDRGLKGLR